MYRLYGLNEEFTCEICGDELYKGRRNFDRHFLEGKHTGNLRLLGIPNTKHFHGVTKIQDAMALYGKISRSWRRPRGGKRLRSSKIAVVL